MGVRAPFGEYAILLRAGRSWPAATHAAKPHKGSGRYERGSGERGRRTRHPPPFRHCGSAPTATGRSSFRDHSDHEPTYNPAEMPATSSASTWCAAETPEPQ